MNKVSQLFDEVSRIEKEILANEADKKLRQVNEFLESLEDEIEIESKAEREEVEALQRELDILKLEYDDVIRQLDEIAENKRRSEAECKRLEHAIRDEQTRAELAKSDEQSYQEDIELLEEEIRKEEDPSEGLNVKKTILENLGVRANCNVQKSCIESITMCSHNNQDIRTISYLPQRPTLVTRQVWNFISPKKDNIQE